MGDGVFSFTIALSCLLFLSPTSSSSLIFIFIFHPDGKYFVIFVVFGFSLTWYEGVVTSVGGSSKKDVCERETEGWYRPSSKKDSE